MGADSLPSEQWNWRTLLSDDLLLMEEKAIKEVAYSTDSPKNTTVQYGD